MPDRAGEQGQQQDAGGQAAQGRRIHRCDFEENTHYATREITIAIILTGRPHG